MTLREQAVEWLRRYPMAVLLLPLMVTILLCYYSGKPIDQNRFEQALRKLGLI